MEAFENGDLAIIRTIRLASPGALSNTAEQVTAWADAVRNYVRDQLCSQGIVARVEIETEAVRVLLAHIDQLESRFLPQPIDTAPVDGRWILAHAPDDEFLAAAPWVIATRCDDGWHDGDGYAVHPTLWAPLPNPQPKQSGWHPAEGTIRIAHATCRDDKGQIITGVDYSIGIVRGDGTCDDYRGADIAGTIEDARARAQQLANKLGLPIVEEPGPAPRLVHLPPHETPQ
ncbi:hypothetical protein NX02_29170 [Sphingomonas sanxanigenens DSM 19645 = NX02]|uniref:DUF551 domain-containing protein n=1 Tax=Sphingomonas sanxanigenens DSM 19645 = NX02 TaxID=1123269 RepID=W0ALD8_9SPHN|nr:hypothetical protein NX02_29170 [Sphingomonas sanxanigenens DSM 19645 = NX02]